MLLPWTRVSTLQVIRRLYSTIPDAASAARASSTPLAVRLRRTKKGITIAPGESDANPNGLTPSEVTRFQRLRAKGELTKEDGSTMSETEWLKELNERRSRVRGTRKVALPGGAVESAVVGKKIYLPNVIFRLVRNYTPTGQPYNPYEATFRVQNSVTKTDIRSYLSAVYGVATTYIRTNNYFASITKSTGQPKRDGTYKRAVVGLVEPFYYPLAMEDMNAEERKKRQNWLEENFHMSYQRHRQRMAVFRKNRRTPGTKGWRWQEGATAGRGSILRLLAMRRVGRERSIMKAKKEISDARDSSAA